MDDATSDGGTTTVSAVDLHDPRKRQEIESSLRAIPDVLGVRIVPGFEREVDEIHVLTNLEKAPKQAVRDVQSMLMARWGVTTDHRVISVVQLDDEQHVPTEDGSRPRVAISRVTVSQSGLTVDVGVDLDDEGSHLEGSSQGPASEVGRRRATARATLEAVRPLLGEDVFVDLEGADVAGVLGHEVAITLVHFHSARGDRTVTGSALVRGDEYDAVARSVLDAVNRAVEDANRD